LKAVTLVAHPDDCVIFAWPFMEAHPELDWSIVYMTYSAWQPRAQEMKLYWSRRNVPTTFLGYRDEWLYVQKGELGFDSERAAKDIAEQVGNFDLILTHYEDGDYGHLHHKFVNQSVQQNDIPKVYFASTFNYNTKYLVKETVALNELPIHREAVECFQYRDTGLYIVTDSAKQLLNK